MDGPAVSRCAGVPTGRERARALAATGAIYLAIVAPFLFWPGASQPPAAPSSASLHVFTLPRPVPPPPPRPRPVPVRRLRFHPVPVRRPEEAPPRAGTPRTPASDPSPLREEPVIASPLLDAPTIAAGGLDAALLGAAGSSGDGGSGNGRTGKGGTGGNGSGKGTGDRYGRAAWIRMPTAAEMQPYWPRRAGSAKLDGHVVLACELPRPGHPRHCTVVAEAPSGYGFGDAAVALSHIFWVKPVTRNDRRLDVPVLIPIAFLGRDGARRP